MRLRDNFATALNALKTNKFRSSLTILGIVIGITSIIVMMSIGKSAESLILGEIGGLGAETIIIRPGKEPTGLSDFGSGLFSDSLKSKDVESLNRKSNAPYIAEVRPAVIVPGSVTYEGEAYIPSIFGASIEFFANTFNTKLQSGVLFDDTDINQNASVAVIGDKVKEKLFGASEAVGQNITIKNRKFRVVGVLEKKGQSGFFNFDEIVAVPYTTAQIYLLGIDYYHEIIVRAENTESVNQTVRDIEITLRENHDILSGEDDDFFVTTQQGVADQIQSIIGALTAFLSSVVAIALVVGGIGVMNIMLVSVTERTREIGLRKALGATDKDIMVQFLLESIILTIVSGVIGIILGAVFSFSAALLISKFLAISWNFVFPISAVFLGLGVAFFVGVIFGLYPARKASKKDPIEALRYE